MTVTFEMLRGPNPEQFRTDYYGARWYIDPLPADPTWPATQDKWPSVTTVKKAWSKPFRKKLPTGETVPLDAYWAADFTLDNLAAINALADDRAAAMALICGAGKRTLNNAADRGDGVHTVLENLAAGQDPGLVDIAVAPFVPACKAFVDELNPQWIAAEIVVVNRTIGYGGTADAIIAIDIPGIGVKICLVDWKSRGGQHGAYEEEIAQIGGYSLAEYLIVTDPDTGTPTRIPLPDIDLGLIVSLTSDGYQAYPVDLEQAQTAFRSMYISWTEHRSGQKAARAARCNPIVPTVSAINPPLVAGSLERFGWIRDRAIALKTAGHLHLVNQAWPTGTPTLKEGGLTDDQITDVAAVLDRIETETGMPFGRSDPLFDGFKTADRTPEIHAPAADPQADPRYWTDKTIELLGEFDQAEQDAILDLLWPDQDRRPAHTTERHHELIDAVIGQLVDPNGAVIFQYTVDGPAVVTTDADDRIRQTCRTKTAALARAKTLARELGRPLPRTFEHVCADPTLAALTAAGLGSADTNNNTNNTDTEESNA